MNNLSIVPGSLQDVVSRSSGSLAESILNCNYLILVDCSYSMITHDSRGGKSRHQVAQEELNKLQASHPGDIAVAAFSDTTELRLSGVLPPPLSGTNLAGALQFAQQFDGTMRFVICSDGEPDDEAAALAIARTFASRIDTIYVGPERDRSGADFLRRLASAAGGQSVTAACASQLAERVETLLIGVGR